MKKYAFTLVELIVVITILTILGTIAFISLNNFSASARDAKRLSDVRSLYTKLTLENVKGTKYEDLIIVENKSDMIINGETRVVAQGVVNFGAIKENRDNFLDPITNSDYPVAFHEAGLVASTNNPLSDPSILEIATISEKKNLAVVVGNYFPQIEGDTSGLILNPTTDKVITNDSLNLPYDIGNGNGEEETNPLSLIPDTIYGDEGETEKDICNKWVIDNIPNDKGEWIWVPAREEYFIDDGFPGGTKMTDDYYKREIEYSVGEGDNEITRVITCLGFAVARYEMSHDDTSIPDSISGADWNTRKYNTDNEILSIPDRYPIANISQEQAIEACKSIGANFHLITNNEYMTIARNIEQQVDNWSGKSVGNGYLSTGLTIDINHGCGDGTSKLLYPELVRNRATKTGVASDLTDPTDCNTKRQHLLSTGERIWDLSGNVREHVNKGNTPITNLAYNSEIAHSNVACSNAESNLECFGFSKIDSDSIVACSFTNGYTYNNMGPITPNLNADNGIGKICTRGTSDQTIRPNNVFRRGSNARDDTQVGIFALNLDWDGIGGTRTAGFRCAL